MTTPADEIRAAANRLRELTADATEGPWVSEDPNTRWGDHRDHHIVGGGKILATFSNDHNGPLNALYTAAMHPGVGTALAQLLEEHLWIADNDPRNFVTAGDQAALTVARAINQH